MIDVQKEILSVIKSNPLMEAIEQQRSVFSEQELFEIAYDYAPTFNDKIKNLQLLVDHASRGTATFAKACIEWEQEMQRAFIQNEENCVFELHIKENVDAYDERYLCSSYEAALEMIPLFYEEYDSEECEEARYRIEKRKVFSGKAQDVFTEDYLGSCDMASGGTVLSVEMESLVRPGRTECDDHCDQCQLACLATRGRVKFPCFVAYGNVVQFQNSYNGKLSYGIKRSHEQEYNDYYIIPLDSYTITYGDFENDFNAHTHVSAPNIVQIIDVEQLPTKYQQRCRAYLEYLAALKE